MKPQTTAIALICTASTAMADPAGLRQTEMYMPHHDRNASVTIWYPNSGGGDYERVAENPVFKGVDAVINADIPSGTHPVVMFSHGMGGTSRAQAWLASALADRGAIVVSVDHAHSTWKDFNMAEGVKHWTRAADLTIALDQLLADPDFEGHIDPSRIMAAGFSYGGWTALSLGGMTGDLAGIVETCTDYIDTMEACDMLLSDKVNMQGIDPNAWNQSYADARITHVAAIDPGFVWGLQTSNVADLVPDVQMIGFGAGKDRMSATNFDDSGLADLLPDAKFMRFDPAFHFTAMPLCKPGAEDILIAENDDPVCTDPVGTDRAAVHGAIIEAVAGELGL
ncbi:alpha/beta hydrolase family protein [Tateyamaria sp.]|uniref:alpha/beta hydrolase family protein n=1 Tax=Tateyamaria sp. TaxID=1929288 RepID=UPI00329E1B74